MGHAEKQTRPFLARDTHLECSRQGSGGSAERLCCRLTRGSKLLRQGSPRCRVKIEPVEQLVLGDGVVSRCQCRGRSCGCHCRSGPSTTTAGGSSRPARRLVDVCEKSGSKGAVGGGEVLECVAAVRRDALAAQADTTERLAAEVPHRLCSVVHAKACGGGVQAKGSEGL